MSIAYVLYFMSNRRKTPKAEVFTIFAECTCALTGLVLFQTVLEIGHVYVHSKFIYFRGPSKLVSVHHKVIEKQIIFWCTIIMDRRGQFFFFIFQHVLRHRPQNVRSNFCRFTCSSLWIMIKKPIYYSFRKTKVSSLSVVVWSCRSTDLSILNTSLHAETFNVSTKYVVDSFRFATEDNRHSKDVHTDTRIHRQTGILKSFQNLMLIKYIYTLCGLRNFLPGALTHGVYHLSFGNAYNKPIKISTYIPLETLQFKQMKNMGYAHLVL